MSNTKVSTENRKRTVNSIGMHSQKDKKKTHTEKELKQIWFVIEQPATQSDYAADGSECDLDDDFALDPWDLDVIPHGFFSDESRALECWDSVTPRRGYVVKLSTSHFNTAITCVVGLRSKVGTSEKEDSSESGDTE